MSTSKYRTIDVKKQHSMSFVETFRLCVKGVRHRFLRSMLTLAVVVLAVAFFMFLLSESMFLRSTGRGVQSEIQHERHSQELLTKFCSPATPMVIVRRLADANRRGDATVLGELAAVTGIPVEEIAVLSDMARSEVMYINWLVSIPSGKRTVLIRKHRGRAAIAHILSDREAFRSRIAPMIDVRIPDGMEGVDAFLDAYEDYASTIEAITARWNERVSAAVAIMDARHGDGRSGDSAWIEAATPEEAEAWRRQLAELGFHFTQSDLALMRRQIAATHARNAVYRALNDAEVRETWAREFREPKPSTAEEKLLKLKDPRAAKIFEGRFSPGTLAQVHEQVVYARKLLRLERKLAATIAEEEGWLGLSGRQIFLLSISFVVCMVGISNAMLMSITERFREIATMKCLGATDSYILLQFMMEAGMQGCLGGLLGVVIGFLIATLRGLAAFGSHLTAYWPWGDVGVSALVSLAAGVFLAILASIYPSWSASRMAPMEAMRVE